MKKIILSLLLGLTLYSAKSQLIVFSTLPSGAILQNNFTGNGVQIDNVNYTGSSTSAGVFSGTSSNIGLNSGILLSTGNVVDAAGLNSNTSLGTDVGSSGDSDLEQLLGGNISTYNAAILEFDFISNSDSVYFKMVYGSEGYDESINSQFADPIAVILSGPGISTPINLALVPSSSDFISINTINSNLNSNLFVDNTSGTTVQYDGFTKPILLKAEVVPCLKYHLKIVIADGGDEFGDSGLFLDAGSLQSGTTNLNPCLITAEYSQGDVTCSGNCDGFAAINQVLGGFEPYTYLWSDGSTESSLNNLCAGPYSVEITDNIGNQTTVNFNILPSQAIQVSSINPQAVCIDDIFSVTLQVSGGASPYSISFPEISPVSTIDEFNYTFLAQDDDGSSYFVQVDDANGCQTLYEIPVSIQEFGYIQGQVFLNSDLNYLDAIQSVEVTLIKRTAANFVWENTQVFYIDQSNLLKTFEFDSIDAGTYVVLAKILPDNLGGLVLPTYSGDKYLWSQSIPISIGSNCSINTNDIHLVNNIDSVQGTGSIEGNIYLSDFFGKTESSNDPIPLIDVVVEKDSTPSISTDNLFYPWNSTYAIEQVPGSLIFPYKFPQMPDGVYKVKVQIPGIPMTATYPVAYTTLTVNNDSIVEINFCADSFELGRIDTCISNASVGLQEKVQPVIEIFPNPSNGQITINLETRNQSGLFILYSLMGEKITEITLQGQNHLDFSTLHLQGIYFAEIVSNGKIHQTKLLFLPRN